MDRQSAEEALAQIRSVVNRVHDETILQNWGVVMIAMAALDLLAFVTTHFLVRAEIERPSSYLAVWGIYTVLALAVNLRARRRTGGTMTYVERHIWGNGLTFYAAGFGVVAVDLAVLGAAEGFRIIPSHLAIIGGMSFAFMALLDLRFFISTVVFFICAGLVAYWQDHGFLVLGAVWFACLLLPGLRYTAERRRLMARGEYTETL